MSINVAKITAGVRARNAAHLIHSLALDEAINHTDDAKLVFWKQVLDNVLAVLPEQYHRTYVTGPPLIHRPENELMG